jgi:general secretion pathway protein J
MTKVRARGFTLIELLVAITVLAIVSMIAWRGLDSLASTRARLAPEADEVRALLISFGQLERDLTNVVQPEFFAMLGSPVEVLSDDRGETLQVVRVAPRSGTEPTRVQTVAYRVIDGSLVRQATVPAMSLVPVVETDTPAVKLLDQVASIRFRFWRSGQGWVEPFELEFQDQIPVGAPPGAPPGDAGAPPGSTPGAAPGFPAGVAPGALPKPVVPQGVELVVERTDGRIYRRVLLVG